MSENTVVRSTCERYDIRLADHRGWAIIMLDERGGVVTIHSDFGNWNFSWPCHGRASLKQFLTEPDRSYLMGKFAGVPDHFNFKKTCESLRADILEIQGRREISEEKANAALKAVEALDRGIRSVYEFYRDGIEADEILREIFDDPLAVHFAVEYEPGIVSFMDRIWPVFVETLRTEIAAKGVAA